MADAGLIVVVAFISPFAAERRMARELMGDCDFVEVFVDTPSRSAPGVIQKVFMPRLKLGCCKT